jgi:putative Holliday junction resolvase
MARILAIDYGAKRTGLAVTDELQIIANGLTTVETPQLFSFLKTYLMKETVELLVVGEPKNLNGTATHSTPLVASFVQKFKSEFAHIPVKLVDERFTSKMATQSILERGVNKKKRMDKSLVDKVSATIILQYYLELKNNLL